MHSRFRLLLPLIVIAGVAHAADVLPADGFTPRRSLGGIDEYRLEANGLDVLLLPDHSAPVVTFMVTYHVGSRNEVTGTTGATHLLEHLMFKGSEHYNADRGTGFDTLLDRIGAMNNATTWLDRTNYFEELPSDHLELAVQLEADRLRGLLLREADRRPEMTVVRNEFERGENDPVEALDKAVTAAAFVAHPYHHPVIGWRSDIEQVPIEKLRAFYDTFYWPNNATVTIIGDFQPAAALALLRKYYGPIPASPRPIPGVYTEEPPQQGPRRVVVKRPGELGVVELAYKVPAALHPDHAALVVLADILADGKTSRFYRALTDQNLTISVDAGVGLTHDPFLLNIYARLAPGATHDQVEKALHAEIARLQSGGVSPEEVTRAINKETAATAYGRDGSFAIASQINEDIAVGDWTYYVTLPEKIKAVTPADVQRVAKAYLVDDQSTTGWFIPVPEGAETTTGSGPATRRPVRHPEYHHPPAAAAGPGASAPPATSAEGAAPTGESALIAPSVHRRTVAGIDVLTLRTSLRDVVTIRGSLTAGDVFNPPDHPALADLTAGMLDKGTTRHDKFALAKLLEDAGAEIQFDTTAQNLAFSARCLKKDLPLVLGLLAEQLRAPAFSATEFAKLQKDLAGRYQQELEDTDFRAQIALDRALFPAGHPNRPPASDEYLADVAAVTLDQVRAFHAAHYGPAAMHLVAVGDVDDNALDAGLAAGFAGWSGGSLLPPAPKAPPLATGRTERIRMPGKASVSVLIGQPSGLRYTDPDRLALSLGTQIFGGAFFSSRLLTTIRVRDGLTYAIDAWLGQDTYSDGRWAIQGTFAPELLDRGLDATMRELRRFVAAGVTDAELRDFKAATIGSYKIGLATSEGVAGQLLANVQRGLPVDYIDQLPAKTAALTLEQVNRAIKDHLRPDSMLTVEAGTLGEANSSR